MHPANPRIYPVGNPVSRALRLALLFTLLRVATGAPLASQAPDSIPPVAAAGIPAAGDPVITQALLPILREHRVPALAAAVVTSAGLERVGVIGVRKQGTSTPVTIEDSWHLGSEPKAMTAPLIGGTGSAGLGDSYE